MTEFLSDEWIDEALAVLAGLPEVEGADGVVQYVVNGSPAGKVQLSLTVVSGRVTSIGAGKHSDPVCTVTLKYDEAMALVGGDLTPEVAFMTGQAKVEGDYGVWLLDLRPVHHAPQTRTVLAELVDASG